MEPLKEAFSKVKDDVAFLNSEIDILRDELSQTRKEIVHVCEIMININKEITQIQENEKEKHQKHIKEEEILTSAQDRGSSTSPTHNPTHLMPFEALKGQNKPLSIGNEGVPTDRQTDQQTDKERENNPFSASEFTSQKEKIPLKTSQNYENNVKNTKNLNFDQFEMDPIDNAAKILESLDSIKREIRLKFKRLTSQEMIVFSTLYQIEEETGQADYRVLSQKLNLTESSVRDYIGKLIKKGIPVEKKRINNKTILLSVSANLKRITSLSTIIQLRDL